ncbi:dCTP deaminase domain-containing protein [Desulfoluna butyratoxydans]|uniref:Dutpase-like n=1 Tax=Desulfoluna butyratoxydans TaxID=231438 RepID=A0A4V6IKT2_9BACT|nr:hypothetical protein [Desulfoluna butyratoxydans]VFQ42408.1 dutpase-like [Desulfoluna butyratoxydans]
MARNKKRRGTAKKTSGKKQNQDRNRGEDVLKDKGLETEFNCIRTNCASTIDCSCGIDCSGSSSCSGNRSGLLVGREIEKHKIIKCEDFEECKGECLQDASYDLRLGEGHYIYSEEKKTWEAIFIGDNLNECDDEIEPHFKRQYLDKKGVLTIPPFGCAFVQLHEDVDCCSIVMESKLIITGRFDLKLSMVRKGLVSQQATQVEPGYNGKLFCYLFNNTSGDVSLNYKSPVATIEFYYSSCQTICDPEVYRGIKKNIENKHFNKYNPAKNKCCNGTGISDVRFFSDGHGECSLPEHGGLSFFYSKFLNDNEYKNKAYEYVSKKIDENFNRIEKNIKSEVWERASFIVAIISLIVCILGLGFYGRYVSRLNAFNDNKANIEKQLTQYEAAINDLSHQLAILKVDQEAFSETLKKK